MLVLYYSTLYVEYVSLRPRYPVRTISSFRIFDLFDSIFRKSRASMDITH